MLSEKHSFCAVQRPNGWAEGTAAISLHSAATAAARIATAATRASAPRGGVGLETWGRDPPGLPFDWPLHHDVHRIGEAAVMGPLVGMGKGGGARYRDGRYEH